ncbi:hypothetical protein [Paractinoplanes rishiriensis]|uniref:Uncharacterized protein n=1 Tax=Paractinoplanes rishiriensis TaxID=1050105 RepID=A0A919K0J1_9ACTN|nr:hypothetical protein [Actinoplanes rishiriensis]GIE94391.1 hypothetical protein Ari01nite_18560 [Actinoplanes rishiriensis]
MLTLWNTRDAQETAEFTTVTVTPGIPFSEYRQRWTLPHPATQSLRPLRLVAVTPPAVPRPTAAVERVTGAGRTGTATRTASGHDDPSAPGTNTLSPDATHPTEDLSDGTSPAGDGTAPGETEGSPPAAEPTDRPAPVRAMRKTQLPPLFNRMTGAIAPPLFGFSPLPPPGSTPAIQTTKYPGACPGEYGKAVCNFLAVTNSQWVGPGAADGTTTGTGTTGGGTSRDAAAARKSELRNLRTVKVKGKGRTTREPLGVVIAVNVDLGGLRGKPVLLSWSMWQDGTGKRLFGDWLNHHLAYELTAETEHDTTGGDFWIPLPAVKDSYFIRAWLTRDDAVLATVDSPSFR